MHVPHRKAGCCVPHDTAPAFRWFEVRFDSIAGHRAATGDAARRDSFAAPPRRISRAAVQNQKTEERFMKTATTLISALVLAACAGKASEATGSFTKSANGVEVHPASGDARVVTLTVRSGGAVQVTAVADPAKQIDPKASLMVVAGDESADKFSIENHGDDVQIGTRQLIAHVSLKT